MPFRKVPSYIRKHGSSYQLFRGVPKDVQKVLGRTKFTEAGGKTLNQARARVPSFISRTDIEIRQARGEKLSPEERLLQQQPDPENTPLDLVEVVAPDVDPLLADGSPNPRFETLLGIAGQVVTGTAQPLMTADGLLTSRRLARQPSPRTFEGWVKALDAFLAFVGNSYPEHATRQQAVAYRDHLLESGARSTAKTQLAYLTGLWSSLEEMQPTAVHIFKGLPGTCNETTEAKAIRAGGSKRNQSFEPSVPIQEWSGSSYVDVFKFLYYSGCRLGEVCALKGSDFHKDYFSVEWSEDRRLKTANSVRDIPIHPQLIDIANQYRSVDGLIWPHLRSEKVVKGVPVVRWGHNLSTPCKKITGNKPKDFRDRVATRLRSGNFNQVLIERLMGHSPTTINSSYGGMDWTSFVNMINSLS